MTFPAPATTFLCLSIRTWPCIPQCGVVSVGDPSVHVAWAPGVCAARLGEAGEARTPERH